MPQLFLAFGLAPAVFHDSALKKSVEAAVRSSHTRRRGISVLLRGCQEKRKVVRTDAGPLEVLA